MQIKSRTQQQIYNHLHDQLHNRVFNEIDDCHVSQMWDCFWRSHTQGAGNQVWLWLRSVPEGFANE